MGIQKRTKLQRERDQQVVADLYLQRIPQAEIAERLPEITGADYNLSQQQISKDIAAIERRWRDRTIDSINAEKNRQLARLDTIEGECWRAWRRSQRDAEKKSMKQRQDLKGDATEKQLVTEPQVGDPRFIERIQECVRERSKILGLHEPQQLGIQIQEQKPRDDLDDILRTVVGILNEKSDGRPPDTDSHPGKGKGEQ